MKQILTTALLLISLLSFGQQNEQYLNYLMAARNSSTTQFFLVVTYKNLNNDEIREICIEGEQLIGAIVKENDLNYSNANFDKIDEIVRNNKERYFEFKNPKAIEILSVPYSKSEFETLKKQIDFKKLAKKASKNNNWNKVLDYKYLTMYAHALFNEGILTYQNGCIGDDTLRIVDKKNPF